VTLFTPKHGTLSGNTQTSNKRDIRALNTLPAPGTMQT